MPGRLGIDRDGLIEMVKDWSSDERRLSRFSNAHRGTLPDRTSETWDVENIQDPEPPPLEHLVEQALRETVRGRGQPTSPYSRFDGSVPNRGDEAAFPSQLIAELHAANGQSQAPDVHEVDIVPTLNPIAWEEPSSGAEKDGSAAAEPRVFLQKLRRLNPLSLTHLLSQGRVRQTPWQVARTLRARFGRPVWPRGSRSGYRKALLWGHRLILDRRVERLLFSRSVLEQAYREREGRKVFRYGGPIPSKVFSWVFSALPANLKHFAFVDFNAASGRTLLLAAARNFEYAAGYTYDDEASVALELNLAQYPRSYLECRDLRALRGDRDGIAIPAQPAVLFLGDTLDDSQFDSLLNHISASWRLNPRPIYVIIENAGREVGLPQMDVFEPVPVPFPTRVKLTALSPAPMALYRAAAKSHSFKDTAPR